jgi:hypothetical protein
MDNKFVVELNTELESIYNNTNFKNNSINDEITNLVNRFNSTILPLLENKLEEAEKYYKEREEYSEKKVDPVNEQVKILMKKMKEEYKDEFNDEYTYSVASSYSAKMNLIGESDIDYFILFKPLTTEKIIRISQLLERYNFKFDKARNLDKVDNVYYIYSQIIDDIEVEVKVRDLYYSRSVVALHDYIDNKLDKDTKILLTYAKYQLKLKSKQDKLFRGYDYFKTLFYNYCFKDIDDSFYIII